MKRIVFSVCILSSLNLVAQQKDTIDLLPVEVRAVRAGSTAPFAKTNISKSEIQKQNLGQDLPFLLSQTPSVVINSDAGNGIGYTGIRIRGTDATRINVTLNGIPYNDAESQGTFFVDLPDFASSISSVQVQRGVGTSTNGAGAFGATLNLSTNEINKKQYVELNNSFGSFDTWKNTIKVGTGLLGNHFTADLRLSRLKSNGYIDRASSDLKSLYFSTAYLSQKSDLRLNIFTGKEKTYQAWYGVSETDLATNRTINYAGMEKPGTPYNNETDNYQQTHYQLFFTHRFTPFFDFNTALFFTKGKGYYEEYRAAQAYSDYGLPSPSAGIDTSDLVRQLWLDNNFYGTIFSLQHHSDKTSVIFGGSITRYDGNHYGKVIWAEKGLANPGKYYDLDANKNDLNIYGKWQQDLTNHLQMFTDLQYRKVSYDLNGFKNNPDLLINKNYNFFNPKLGLSYHYNNWLAYASYSVANKEPNRDDFEANTNEQPRPERLNDIEAGLENKTTKSSVGANLYYMKYKDQLVLTGKINDVGAYTRTNIDDSYRLGIELQGSVVASKWLRAAANLTLSENKIRNYNEFIDDYDNGGQKVNFYPETDIALSPSVTGSATFTITPVLPLSIDFLSKYVGKQYLDNSKNEGRRLNAYFLQDVRAAYSFNYKWLKNVNLVFQVNNLLNKKYEPNGYTFSYYYNNNLSTENYYFPMAGINWMAGINIKL
jgi:iron complex outermembrane recepter protein